MADDTGAGRLAKYVQATPGDEYVTDAAAEAAAMVSNHLKAGNTRGEVPAAIIARARLEVGAELFHRRTSRNGVVGLDGGPDNFAPLRIARDPMKAAYDVLAPYMLPAIG